MKRVMLFVLVALSLVVALPVAAQGGKSTPIAIGDTVKGEISNQAFEQLYSFDGEAGTMIDISMTADDYGFDAYLFLLDSTGATVAENDDFEGLDPRIMVELPATEAYTIIASRRSGRSGEGEGTYSLTVQALELLELGTEQTFSLSYGGTYPVHAFRVPAAGLYSVTYSHVEGDVHPNFEITYLDTEYGYIETLASVSGLVIPKAMIWVMIEDPSTIYYVTMTENYYEYLVTDGDVATYTVQVQSQE